MEMSTTTPSSRLSSRENWASQANAGVRTERPRITVIAPRTDGGTYRTRRLGLQPGYSPLDPIDGDNVGDLRMVWTRDYNRKPKRLECL